MCLNPCFSGGWSRREVCTPRIIFRGHVLILVLVEDGLGVCGIPGHRESSLLVLILVLVEDGLGVTPNHPNGGQFYVVLILVLVEDGLGVCSIWTTFSERYRLNPCFSGGWSRRKRY